MRELFLLNPEIIFLNHGSFGATPRPVFENYQAWQLELERQPVEFFGRRSKELLKYAREELASYLHTSANNLVYMTNVTVALNAVARSLQLKEGDEVLATNQEYGALNRTWNYLSRQRGFKYINTPVDIPVTTPEKYVEDFWKGVTPHTRVIFISHISSVTAIIAPIKEICQRARSQGILSVIDGAHAPGQLPLDMEEIDADFYGANLHKWLCAPKGSGFLYASPRVHALLHPLVVSFGWESDQPGISHLVDLYEYMGTRDLAPFLAVPEAIAFQNNNHWEMVRQQCHELAKRCLIELCQSTGLTPLYAPDSDWFAQMVTIPIPEKTDINILKDRLLEDYQIEVPFVTWEERPYVRGSFQAYNTCQELDIFLSAMRDLLHI